MIPAPVLQFFRGFCMGAADIVPGVSGGTVALILGIYKQLIANVRAGAHALKQFVTGDLKGGLASLIAVEWLFLLPLGGGVLVAFALLRHPMKDLLHDRPEGIAAVFCGLVAASCVLVWRSITTRDALRLGVLAAVAVAAFFLLGLKAGTIDDPSLPLFFATGAIAICAMILPGISGSFIMLMFGMYAAVLGGSIGELAVFLVGATIGLGAFSSLLNWLLAHHEQTVLAALLGLMVGSIRVLWPWPHGVGVVSDEAAEVVDGTAMHLPDGGQALGGLALAAVAAALTLVVVRFAEDDDTEPVLDVVTPG
ncbi:MAG: DUF368 domain-containing protein [Acidimicrobiales bacterium]